MTSVRNRARMAVRAIVLCLCCALSLSLASPSARAQGARAVLVDPEAADAVDPELWSTLQGLFRNIDVRVVDESRRTEDLVARVVLSPSANGVTIVVFDPRRADRGVRREVSRGDSPTIYRETVAQVLLSVVEPMAERPLPTAPVTPPAAAPPPLVSAAPQPVEREAVESDPEIQPSTKSYSLGPRTGLNWLSSDVMRPGFGAHLGVRFEERKARPQLLLEALGFLPNDFNEQGAKARLRASSLRVASLAELWNQRGLGLEAGGAVGADLLTFDPQQLDPRLRSGPTTRRVQPVISARLVMRVRLTKVLSFLLGGALDLDLAPRRWAVQRGPEQISVFETARFRPQLLAALDWTFAEATLSKGQNP